jgi:cytochrome c1
MWSIKRSLAARLLGTAALVLLAGACGDAARGGGDSRVLGGNPEIGERLIVDNGCGNCHTIPGVRGARGTVGPPLTQFAERDFIAGKFENEPGNLVAWIMNPPKLDPGVAMPDMGITEEEARHIAAYLYTLR